MAHFGRQEMFERGTFTSFSSSVLSRGEEKVVVGVCWLDRSRKHIVATAGRISVTTQQQRIRWRQRTDGACPVEVHLDMPELVKDYFSVCGAIDTHNRIRQDSLDLEKKP